MRAMFITILLALALGGGGMYVWIYYGGFEPEQGKAVAFIDTYGDYAEVADVVEALVHLPGTEDNADRAELQALLETILTDNTLTPERRETLARLAYANLDVVKKEIDAAQSSQAEVYQHLQDLDNAARVFKGMRLRSEAEGIVTLARKRAELTARITSVLSETHDQTYSIITQILEDDGELSHEHVTAINSSTDKAEERHDLLIGLYDELIAQKVALDDSFAGFARDAI